MYMGMSAKKLVLAVTACLFMAPLPIVTGMGEESPSRLAAFFAGLPISVWMGLIIMTALVVGAWLSIDDETGDARP
jgi:di/tricarboxylate transporter